jgi:1,4-dihydroxy-2-naphthoate octaprenyltransferase
MTSYYLQTSTINLSLLRASVPLALLTFALTLATELPDIAADIATGKMTLVARLGTNKTVWLQGAFLVVGWLSCVTVIACLWPFWGLVAIAVTVPFVAVSLVSARASRKGSIAAMERMGLAHSIVLGYAALAVSIALLIG